jgi:hypothetical protein
VCHPRGTITTRAVGRTAHDFAQPLRPHRLREVLGDQTYEQLARRGETMTTAAMVAYALEQIDQARAELDAVSK